MGLAWSKETRDNQGGGRIDTELDLAVGASLLPMDRGEPVVLQGIGPSDLKAGGIDHNAAGTLRPERHGQAPAPAVQGGGIGNRQRQPGKRQNRAHEADGLAKRQAINFLQEQSQQDDLVRVNDGTTPVWRSALAAFGPLGGTIIPQPDGQAAAIGQFTIIFFPVYFLLEKLDKKRVHLNAFI